MQLKNIVFFCLTLLSPSILAQTIVNTQPGPRKAILEEFTGVNCPNCPYGHQVMDDLLNNLVDEAYSISYCPENSSYTEPSGNQSEFRRPFLNDFYAHSYCSPATEQRFMPTAFINRIVWADGDRIQSTSLWEDYAEQVVSSGNSPMNIGVQSQFDSIAQQLTVDVEIYYHTDVAVSNSFYVFLGERNLISYSQSGAMQDPYIYKHMMFRETLTAATWGDPVLGNTTAGSLFQAQYVFDMADAIAPMDIDNLDVLAFIIEDQTTEIYTGIQTKAKGGVASTGTTNVGISATTKSELRLYPNPVSNTLTLHGVHPQASVRILNSMGQELAQVPRTDATIKYATNHLPAGVYFVNILSETQSITKKFVKN